MQVREIKLRAYDPYHNQMIEWGDLVRSPAFNMILAGTGYPMLLTQYTGLHDSTPWEEATPEQRKGYTKETWKGVEIYEGDIVRKKQNKPILIDFRKLEGQDGGLIMGFEMPSAYVE